MYKLCFIYLADTFKQSIITQQLGLRAPHKDPTVISLCQSWDLNQKPSDLNPLIHTPPPQSFTLVIGPFSFYIQQKGVTCFRDPSTHKNLYCIVAALPHNSSEIIHIKHIYKFTFKGAP